MGYFDTSRNTITVIFAARCYAYMPSCVRCKHRTCGHTTTVYLENSC